MTLLVTSAVIVTLVAITSGVPTEHRVTVNHGGPSASASGHFATYPIDSYGGATTSNNGKQWSAGSSDTGSTSRGSKGRSSEYNNGDWKRLSQQNNVGDYRDEANAVSDGRSATASDGASYKKDRGHFYERGGEWDREEGARKAWSDSASRNDASAQAAKSFHDKSSANSDIGHQRAGAVRDHKNWDRHAHSKKAHSASALTSSHGAPAGPVLIGPQPRPYDYADEQPQPVYEQGQDQLRHGPISPPQILERQQSPPPVVYERQPIVQDYSPRDERQPIPPPQVPIIITGPQQHHQQHHQQPIVLQEVRPRYDSRHLQPPPTVYEQGPILLDARSPQPQQPQYVPSPRHPIPPPQVVDQGRDQGPPPPSEWRPVGGLRPQVDNAWSLRQTSPLTVPEIPFKLVDRRPVSSPVIVQQDSGHQGWRPAGHQQSYANVRGLVEAIEPLLG